MQSRYLLKNKMNKTCLNWISILLKHIKKWTIGKINIKASVFQVDEAGSLFLRWTRLGYCYSIIPLLEHSLLVNMP